MSVASRSSRLAVPFVWVSIGILWCFFNLHSSSLQVWQKYAPTASDDSLVAGTPRPIRSDDWLVWVPFAASQVHSNPPFQQENLSLGAGRIPLIAGLPSYEVATVFRPHLWGYLSGSLNFGLSWHWLYRWVGLLLGGYYLLRSLLADSSRRLLVSGTLILTFSSFLQWWMSTTLPEMIISSFLVMLSASALVKATSRKALCLSSVCLWYSAIQFGLFFYPPFLIPLALVAGCFVLSSALDAPERVQTSLKAKILLLVVVGVAVALCYGGILYGARETLEATFNTVYPGKRVSTHSGFAWERLFIGFAGPAFDEDLFPKRLGNVCEASTFIFLWPLVFLGVMLRVYRGESLPRRLWCLTIATAFLAVGILIGIPSFLARITLLTMVQTHRLVLGLGVLSWLLWFCWSDVEARYRSVAGKQPLLPQVGSVVMAVGCALLVSYVLNQSGSRYDYSLPNAVYFGLVLFWGVFVYFFFRSAPLRANWLLAILLLSSNLLTNPLSKGVKPLLDNKVAQTVELASGSENTGDRRWLVVNHSILPQVLKAKGQEVIGGVQFLPRADLLEVLDAEQQFGQIHNRYAHIRVLHDPSLTKPVFTLDQNDAYAIRLDVCDGRLEKLGVTGVVVAGVRNAVNIPCLEDWQHRRAMKKVHVYWKESTNQNRASS